jgi:hypothetical protein
LNVTTGFGFVVVGGGVGVVVVFAMLTERVMVVDAPLAL